MSFGDFLGEVFKRSAVALGTTAAGAGVEHGSRGLGRRLPRALGLARLGGGALLVLGGLLWVATDTVLAVLVLAGSSSTIEVQGAGDAALLGLVWLVDLALGLAAVVWGLRLMRRGWASAR